LLDHRRRVLVAKIGSELLGQLGQLRAVVFGKPALPHPKRFLITFVLAKKKASILGRVFSARCIRRLGEEEHGERLDGEREATHASFGDADDLVRDNVEGGRVGKLLIQGEVLFREADVCEDVVRFGCL